MIQSKVYARVGLAGNPSDGFNGKCLSACVRNWSAQVSLAPSDRITINTNHQMDATEFRNLKELTAHSDRYGYYGALRLIHATCSKFHKLTGLDVNNGNGFEIHYKSTIPRQVGLGGSSALVVALLNCLIEFTGWSGWSEANRANVAWAVENEELGITAGLQDRVVQTYGGLVYMDFNKELMAKQGYGCYEKLSYSLPSAFIAHTLNPRKNSGQVHNPVRFQYNLGNKVVINAMELLGKLARDAREYLEEGDYYNFANEMNLNWITRLALYGDERIGQDNITMVRLAQRCGCYAKLPGSGGAVIGLYKDEEQYAKLKQTYESEGYNITKVIWDQKGI